MERNLQYLKASTVTNIVWYCSSEVIAPNITAAIEHISMTSDSYKEEGRCEYLQIPKASQLAHIRGQCSG